jgi:hypothetical protein
VQATFATVVFLIGHSSASFRAVRSGLCEDLNHGQRADSPRACPDRHWQWYSVPGSRSEGCDLIQGEYVMYVTTRRDGRGGMDSLSTRVSRGLGTLVGTPVEMESKPHVAHFNLPARAQFVRVPARHNDAALESSKEALLHQYGFLGPARALESKEALYGC